MENVCKHVNINLITDGEKLRKSFAKLNFDPAKFMSNDLILVRMKKDNVLLNHLWIYNSPITS